MTVTGSRDAKIRHYHHKNESVVDTLENDNGDALADKEMTNRFQGDI